ncbi:MAG: response regulator [Candidatus Cloacimonetes bacterium]|jgi:signal transduction histidine kinase/CheY-like chemotaxis protein|nr:response regulator [Candidatus Cloacimonadota bacterium]
MKKNLTLTIIFFIALVILIITSERLIESQKQLYLNKSQAEIYYSLDMIEFFISMYNRGIFKIEDVNAFFNKKMNNLYEILILTPDKSTFYATQNLKNPLSPNNYETEIYSNLDTPLTFFSFDFIVDNKLYITSVKKIRLSDNKFWYIIFTAEHSDLYSKYKSWRVVWHSISISILIILFLWIRLLQRFKVNKIELNQIKNKEKCFLQNIVENENVSMSLLADTNGTIEAISPNLLSYLKYTQEEVIDNNIKMLTQDIVITNEFLSDIENHEIIVQDKYHNKFHMFVSLLPCNKKNISYDINQQEDEVFEKIIILFNDLTIIKESNIRLEKEIYKNQIFTKIAQMITISHEPKHIIKTIIEETKNLIEYDSGTLFLLDNSDLIPYYTNNENLSHLMNSIKLKVGEGLTGLVAKIRKGMIINDAINSPVAVNIEDTPAINECLISCPLINNDNLIGVVTFSREGSNYFTDDDLKILELLSVQAAAVLDNSILLKRLRDSENKYFSMINESALGMIILNNRKISFSNKRFSQYLEYPVISLLNKDITELISSKDKSFFASQLTTFLLEGKIEVFEIELTNANQQPVTFEFSLSSIIWENTPSILITAGNVTEKVELNKQLLQTQKLESVGALASGIAHDFKNVLAGVIGAADMIILKSSDSSPINNFAKIIKTSAERGSKLAQRLLGFSRKEEQDKQIFDINELLKEVVEIISYTFEKNIELVHNLSEEPLFFEGDSVKIQQCLLNLCVNARDAMPNGGTLKVESLIIDNLETKDDFYADYIDNKELETGRKYNIIKISDTGSGIPESIQESIFEPFFTTKEKGKGTGLGLSTTKSIIKEYKGIIYLNSEINKGTSFTILLPWINNINEENITPTQINYSSPQSILLVDDEEIVLDVAKDLLEELGNTVYPADNGIDALKILKSNNSINFAIIDRMMPKMDGLTLFRKIKSFKPDVKVIIASGYVQKSEAESIIAEGAYDFISKPYHLEDLVKLLKNSND